MSVTYIITKNKTPNYCPMGQPMKRIGTKNRTMSNGYPQSYALYQAKNCHNCPLRGGCHHRLLDWHCNHQDFTVHRYVGELPAYWPPRPKA